MDVLQYLGLPPDSSPNPETQPLHFLSQNIRILPQNLLLKFSENTTPKERTSISTIRNRRFKYSETNPEDLRFESAISEWPTLWKGTERRGQAEGRDEKKWAEKEFMGGTIKQHVGQLGRLLAEYEEDRGAERFREERRSQAAAEPFVPEEDDDESDEEEVAPIREEEPESPEQARTSFERLIREKFIYGLLESDLYDTVDWDEQWDGETDREAEDRWFDEEDENDM